MRFASIMCLTIFGVLSCCSKSWKDEPGHRFEERNRVHFVNNCAHSAVLTIDERHQKPTEYAVAKREFCICVVEGLEKVMSHQQFVSSSGSKKFWENSKVKDVVAECEPAMEKTILGDMAFEGCKEALVEISFHKDYVDHLCDCMSVKAETTLTFEAVENEREMNGFVEDTFETCTDELPALIVFENLVYMNCKKSWGLSGDVGDMFCYCLGERIVKDASSFADDPDRDNDPEWARVLKESMEACQKVIRDVPKVMYELPTLR